jgi:hypothetical protein
MQTRKLLAPEVQAEIREKELQDRLYRKKPSYLFTNSSNLDTIRCSVVEVVLRWGWFAWILVVTFSVSLRSALDWVDKVEIELENDNSKIATIVDMILKEKSQALVNLKKVHMEWDFIR